MVYDGPARRSRKVLDRAGWQAGTVVLYEISEAFACVTMVAIQELGLDHARVNVNGGHARLVTRSARPARLITTLVHALRHRGLKRGIASQCIGGGELPRSPSKSRADLSCN